MLRKLLILLGLMLPMLLHANWYSWETRTNQTLDELKRFEGEMRKRGFHPTNIQATAVNGETRFCSIWALEDESPAWQIAYNQSPNEFNTDFEVKKQGYYPLDMAAYNVNGTTRYTTIWYKYVSGGWYLYKGMSESGLKSRINELSDKGYQAIDVNAYVENGNLTYSAIWTSAAVGRRIAFGLNATQYQAEFNEMSPKGYVPIDLDVVNFGGQQIFSVIWVYDKTQTWEARHHFTEKRFQDFMDEYTNRGYALVDVTCYQNNGIGNYACLFKKMLGNKAPSFQPVAAPAPDPSKVVAANSEYTISIAPVAQQTDVWCWLAVGEMICKNMGVANANPAGNYQCGIIGTIAPAGSPCRSNCMSSVCITGSGSNYNTLKMLRDYIWIMSNRVLGYKEGYELPFATIKKSIDKKQPILCGTSYYRRSYFDGAEHAVLIVGYKQTQEEIYVIVNDPFTYTSNNPYIIEGGSRIAPYQYRIPLKAFTERIFWHWSIYDLQLI